MQDIKWPAISVTASNPSIATNGQSPSATSSTLVAGQNPSGDQQPLQTDVGGALLVSIDPSATPFDVNLIQVAGSAITLGQKTMASSLPVVLASDEVVPISAAALPLPAGAATEAKQDDQIVQETAIAASAASIDTKQSTMLTRLSGSLVPTAYDEIQLGYTGANLTSAIYKLAGSTVKTLTLSYTGAILDSVVAS